MIPMVDENETKTRVHSAIPLLALYAPPISTYDAVLGCRNRFPLAVEVEGGLTGAAGRMPPPPYFPPRTSERTWAPSRLPACGVPMPLRMSPESRPPPTPLLRLPTKGTRDLPPSMAAQPSTPTSPSLPSPPIVDSGIAFVEDSVIKGASFGGVLMSAMGSI